MPVDTLSGFPCSFTAGETVRVRVVYSSYPASAWSASLSLRSALASQTLAATADGDNFVFVLTATNTAALKPGVYRFAVTVSDGSTPAEVTTAEVGWVKVKPNMAETSVGPRRAAYEAARAALEALAGKKLSSVSVEGESYTYQSLGELMRLVEMLEASAIAEDAERGLLPGGGLKRIQMVTR